MRFNDEKNSNISKTITHKRDGYDVKLSYSPLLSLPREDVISCIEDDEANLGGFWPMEPKASCP